jgi:hypothetical protein
MRKLATLMLIALLSACASTYKQDVVSAPTAKLDRGKPVLIATPRNGRYEGKEYPSSGIQTASAVQAAFARFSDKADVSADCSDQACLQAGADQSYAYFVIPEILHWEDRNTEWSGKSDLVDVRLTVLNAQSRGVVASIVISGKSKWATFGGDHPQDLLPEPITKYVESLY